jgi:hypothetical protein
MDFKKLVLCYVFELSVLKAQNPIKKARKKDLGCKRFSTWAKKTKTELFWEFLGDYFDSYSRSTF